MGEVPAWADGCARRARALRAHARGATNHNDATRRRL